MLSKSELFRTAHKNAKSYREYFDCYKLAFSFALTELYAQEKAQLKQEKEKMEKKTLEQVLVSRGCKVWEKGDKRRIYVDLEKEKDMKAVFEITWDHVSNSGWKSGYTINGEKVSGCSARKFIGKIEKLTDDNKLFFDCTTEKWIGIKCSWNGKIYYQDITDDLEEFLPESITDQVA